MYLYVFKDEQFIDRIFVNSNDQINETVDEIHDKNGPCDVLICDEYHDTPVYMELLKGHGKTLSEREEELIK